MIHEPGTRRRRIALQKSGLALIGSAAVITFPPPMLGERFGSFKAVATLCVAVVGLRSFVVLIQTIFGLG